MKDISGAIIFVTAIAVIGLLGTHAHVIAVIFMVIVGFGFALLAERQS